MIVIKNGVVDNFIVILPAQIPEFQSETVQLVEESDPRVRRGDAWDGEQFFRDGIPLSELEEQQ